MCTCGRMPLSWDHLKSLWQNWVLASKYWIWMDLIYQLLLMRWLYSIWHPFKREALWLDQQCLVFIQKVTTYPADMDSNWSRWKPHQWTTSLWCFFVVYQLIDTPMSAYHPFPWNVGLIDPLHHGFWGCVWGAVAEVMDTQGWVSFSGALWYPVAVGMAVPRICGFLVGTQFQELETSETSIFRHAKSPSHPEPIWCRLYPFRETVTWFRRFDPIPQASRTREQRKCECNSQTGWLGMGMWWLGDPRFYFSKISKP